MIFLATYMSNTHTELTSWGFCIAALKSRNFPLASAVLFSFLVKYHLTSATNNIWTIFLSDTSVDYCLPEGLSLMETNCILMEMKLQWKPDYFEKPKLFRRKMTNRAFDKSREQALSHTDTKFCYMKIS